MRIFITGTPGSDSKAFSRALGDRLRGSGYTSIDLSLFLETQAPPTLRAPRRYDPAWISEMTSLCAAPLQHTRSNERLIVEFPFFIDMHPWGASADLMFRIDGPEALRRTRMDQPTPVTDFGFDAAEAFALSLGPAHAFCDALFVPESHSTTVPHLVNRIAPNILALDTIESRALHAVGPLAWRGLVRAYMQNHRQYHTPQHLQSLFEALEHLAPQWSQDPAITLAILYHDFIYETGPLYSHNEFRSAQALWTHARDFFRPPSEHAPFESPLSLAQALILSTSGHKIIDPWILNDPQRYAKACVFLDADLSILGASSDEDFDQYDHDIRQEFNHIPEPDYRRLRAQALRHFLARPHGSLYLTPQAQSWETLARTRLARCCATLEPDVASVAPPKDLL